MPVFVAPPTLGDLLKYELNPGYCRETITLKAGTDYPLGAVLGRITASGLYRLSPAAKETGDAGAEVAAAVLLEAVDATDGDTSAVIAARGPAILAEGALAFDPSVDDDTKKTAKKVQLAAAGLVSRITI